MKLTLPAAAALLAAFTLTHSLPAQGTTPAPGASTEILEPLQETPGLPRVLLLGDSISGGYAPFVRKQLQGLANVRRCNENCKDTNYGLTRLDAWLDNGRWDVIHFNFGLHDMKYVDAKGDMVPVAQGTQVSTLERYEANLRRIVARLKKTGARLVFATTTPIPPGANGRVAHDELRYNDVAVRVMRELGVPINDLHAVVVPVQSRVQKPANVHYLDEGSSLMADAVVARIKPLLPTPPRTAR